MTTPRDAGALRALVTGTTGGIGRATSFALLGAARRRGLQLRIAVGASRSAAALDTLVRDLEAEGAVAYGMAADLADAAACARLGEGTVDRCEGLHILVSNAGIARGAPLASLEVADWDAVFTIDACTPCPSSRSIT